MADSIQSKFADAWGEVKNPDLDSVNPHFKNRYASLKATLKAIRAVCAPRGLVYRQSLKHHDWGYMLHSSVEDGAGERIELSEFPVETPPNAQSFGSDLTYRKRQQAQADWGVTGEEDDDGEAAANSRQAGPLDSAKQRLWRAVKAYAAKNGRDPNDVMKDVQKRPEWASQQGSADYLNSVAAEYEELANG